jgi:hypothetical protein
MPQKHVFSTGGSAILPQACKLGDSIFGNGRGASVTAFVIVFFEYFAASERWRPFRAKLGLAQQMEVTHLPQSFFLAYDMV